MSGDGIALVQDNRDGNLVLEAKIPKLFGGNHCLRATLGGDLGPNLLPVRVHVGETQKEVQRTREGLRATRWASPFVVHSRLTSCHQREVCIRISLFTCKGLLVECDSLYDERKALPNVPKPRFQCRSHAWQWLCEGVLQW